MATAYVTYKITTAKFEDGKAFRSFLISMNGSMVHFDPTGTLLKHWGRGIKGPDVSGVLHTMTFFLCSSRAQAAEL